MSSAASWSYTAKATHWKRTGVDDWTGQTSFASPVVFLCDYSAQNERMVNAAGNDFVSRQTIYTEYADCKEGDYVLVGESAEASPYVAGAQEVRAVLDYGDTLERRAPDYKVVT